MTDATEVRSDTVPTPAEPQPAATPAAEAAPAETAAPAVTMTAVEPPPVAAAPAFEPAKVMEPPEPAGPAEATIAEAPPIILPKAPSLSETPPISVTPPEERLAAPATGGVVAWIGQVRAGLAGAITANRTAILAGALGFVAGIGLLAATLGVMGAGHLFASTADTQKPWSSVAEDTRALKQTVTRLEAQVTSLKASIESSNRNTSAQRAQITSRSENSARTQAEMQTRLAKIGDAVERLEKRVTAAVAAEATGSTAPRQAAAASAAPPSANAPVTLGAPPQPLGVLVETQPAPTAATAAPAAAPKPAVVEGWAIRDVFRGRALVTSRRGVFEAAPGLYLPELGRVEAVTRENGRWVVVTEKGLITAMRR